MCSYAYEFTNKSLKTRSECIWIMEDCISMLICYINKEHVYKDLKSNLEAKKSALAKLVIKTTHMGSFMGFQNT